MRQMLVIECEDHYRKVVEWARENGLLGDFMRVMGYLAHYGSSESRCTLGGDFAPHSFVFLMEFRGERGEWVRFMNGGVIFHESQGGWGVHT